MLIEINLYKRKWLIAACYNPHKNKAAQYFSKLSSYLNPYIISYDNLFLMGDFNVQPEEDIMKDFCSSYNLKHLITVPTCFKNVDNPSTVDLMLTNKYRSFTKSSVLETGLSDFHKLAVTVLNTTYQKNKPKKIYYRNYKNYSNENLRNDLQTIYSWGDIQMMNNDTFNSIFVDILNIHAPLKVKYIRANHNPFVTKELRKAIMKRSKLKNKFNKEKTKSSKLAYSKQRNFCSNLLKKIQKIIL